MAELLYHVRVSRPVKPVLTANKKPCALLSSVLVEKRRSRRGRQTEKKGTCEAPLSEVPLVHPNEDKLDR